MHKLRIIPWLFGIALIVTTIAGANRLIHPGESPAAGNTAAPLPKPAAPMPTEGLVAKGTVQSDPPVVAYTLPAHLVAGTIAEVPVRGGDVVKPGDMLLRFDTALLQRDLEEADTGYSIAFEAHQNAVVKQKQHALIIEKATLALNEAKQSFENAKKAANLAKTALEKELDAQKNPDSTPLTPDQRETRRKEDVRILQTESLQDKAESHFKEKQLDAQLAHQESESLTALASQANFQAHTIMKKKAKIQQAIDDSTIKAKAPGTIEQVSAAVGQTVYPQTRPPLLYLVPTGQRVVWAEVVPEFAHKIKDRIGQKVIVSDDSNTNLTYEGTVKRIGTAFLAKPNGTPEILNGKPNVVLTVEIDIVDASPAGKPPLRSGQPVRVAFP
jgi:multidrug resistance efflux pump